MDANRTLFLNLLPRVGFQYCDHRGRYYGTYFMTGYQYRAVTRSMRSNLPGNDQQAFDLAFENFFNLCTENVELCSTMEPSAFMNHIKRRYKWMRKLDGAVLLQLLRKLWFARGVVYDDIQDLRDAGAMVPSELTQRTNVTVSFDKFFEAFCTLYTATPHFHNYFAQIEVDHDVVGDPWHLDHRYLERRRAWYQWLREAEKDRQQELKELGYPVDDNLDNENENMGVGEGETTDVDNEDKDTDVGDEDDMEISYDNSTEDKSTHNPETAQSVGEPAQKSMVTRFQLPLRIVPTKPT